jgi:hypothetical protein
MIFYIVIGILWGGFAAAKSNKIYGRDSSPFIAFLTNAAAWPIAILIAIARYL